MILPLYCHLNIIGYKYNLLITECRIQVKNYKICIFGGNINEKNKKIKESKI